MPTAIYCLDQYVAVAEERATYRASQDAFFKEKNYEKAAQLEKQYKAMHAANENEKLNIAVAKAGPLRITGTKQGSSVRDEGPSGKTMTNAQIAARAKKLGKYNPITGEPMGNVFE